MTVYFVGWYGKQNSGDEAFKLVHQALLPHHDLRWMNGSETVPAKKGDVIVLGSGDVVRPHYVDAIPPGAKFIIYGAGLDGDADAKFIEKLRPRIIAAWFRSPQSVALAKSLGVPAHYTPDIVFNVRTAARDAVSDVGKRQIKTKRKQAILFVSNNFIQFAMKNNDAAMLGYSVFFKNQLSHALVGLSDYYNIKIISLSFNTNDFDHAFAADLAIMSGMDQSKIFAEPNELSIKDVWREIAQADLVISMKFHGLIYAMCLGVPFINIGLSRKCEMFCHDNDMSGISIRPFSYLASRFWDQLKNAEKPEFLDHIEKVSQDLQAQAAAAAKEFVATVDRCAETCQ